MSIYNRINPFVNCRNYIYGAVETRTGGGSLAPKLVLAWRTTYMGMLLFSFLFFLFLFFRHLRTGYWHACMSVLAYRVEPSWKHQQNCVQCLHVSFAGSAFSQLLVWPIPGLIVNWLWLCLLGGPSNQCWTVSNCLCTLANCPSTGCAAFHECPVPFMSLMCSSWVPCAFQAERPALHGCLLPPAALRLPGAQRICHGGLPLRTHGRCSIHAALWPAAARGPATPGAW